MPPLPSGRANHSRQVQELTAAGFYPAAHFTTERVLDEYLRDVLVDLKLARDGLGWYESTRHTMASQWVLATGSLETLQRILGHSTVLVTERYSHLRPGHYNVADRNRLAADFESDSVRSASESASKRVLANARKRAKAA